MGHGMLGYGQPIQTEVVGGPSTHGTLPELATSPAPSGRPRRREHIEHRTDGRGPGKTALQGAGENSLQPAEIYDLGADLVQMDSCQRLNLGARCPARFGESEQFLDLADGKADLACAPDKHSRSICSGS
jgi:hypothetical protein